MRTFELWRFDDVHGVSGVGIVVEGVEFNDGRTAYRWMTKVASTTIADSVHDIGFIHGHNGKTRIVWSFGEPFEIDDEVVIDAERAPHHGMICKVHGFTNSAESAELIDPKDGTHFFWRVDELRKVEPVVDNPDSI